MVDPTTREEALALARDLEREFIYEPDAERRALLAHTVSFLRETARGIAVNV